MEKFINLLQTPKQYILNLEDEELIGNILSEYHHFRVLIRK